MCWPPSALAVHLLWDGTQVLVSLKTSDVGWLRLETTNIKPFSPHLFCRVFMMLRAQSNFLKMVVVKALGNKANLISSLQGLAAPLLCL